MNFARRLFSSTARVANTLIPVEAAPAAPSVIPAEQLPPVLQRYIKRNLAEGAGKAVRLHNPFLVSSRERASKHDVTEVVRIYSPPTIPPRRQKQLLAEYPAELLPPSRLNPVKNTPVRWENGTIITWAGKVKPKEETSVYGEHKREIKGLFKGKKAEREREAKLQARADRLKTMEKRIADWKKTKADTRAKTKSSLPF